MAKFKLGDIVWINNSGDPMHGKIGMIRKSTTVLDDYAVEIINNDTGHGHDCDCNLGRNGWWVNSERLIPSEVPPEMEARFRRDKAIYAYVNEELGRTA